MSSPTGGNEKSLFGLTVGQAIRYAYPGLLFALLAAYVDGPRTKTITEALGIALAPLVALLVGIGIYVFYREVLGEWILFNIRHHLHTLYDKCRRKAPTSFTAYFGSIGVPYFYRRWFYRVVRSDSPLPDQYRARLDFVHSELSVLYITAIETGVAGLYLRSLDRPSLFLLISSGLAMLSGFLADIRQDQFETRMLRLHEAELKEKIAQIWIGKEKRQ